VLALDELKHADVADRVLDADEAHDEEADEANPVRVREEHDDLCNQTDRAVEEH